MASIKILLKQQLSDGRKSVSQLDFPSTGRKIYAISLGDHSSHDHCGLEELTFTLLQGPPAPSHGKAALC
jgi:hypothetical protein